METIAKRLSNAPEIEFIMHNINSVFALMPAFGMDLLAWLNLSVAVERFGMKLVFDAIAQNNLIWMDKTVSSVSMAKFGSETKENVDAEKAHNGMVIFVLLFKIAMEDPFGIKTHGHANVPLQPSGMVNSVLKILALGDKSGTIS